MNPLISRTVAVFVARNKEFWRDRAALSWNIALPVMVILFFGFAFQGDSADQYQVGVLGEVPVADSGFFATRHVSFVAMDDLSEAQERVRQQRLDMLLDPDSSRYWINGDSTKGYFLERLLLASEPGVYRPETVAGTQLRYVDWLFPGVLGMNMMFSALWGVGYIVVRYRKNGVLKRLKATPLSPLEFLVAQVASRLWVILGVTSIVYVGAGLAVDFQMSGNLLALTVVFLAGAVSLISLGLVVASRVANEELADGILNLISWPMMLLSGVWFSVEGLHPSVRLVAQAFPLTHVNTAARAIMLEGSGLTAVAPQLLVLVLMSALFLAVGSWLFRWE